MLSWQAALLFLYLKVILLSIPPIYEEQILTLSSYLTMNLGHHPYDKSTGPLVDPFVHQLVVDRGWSVVGVSYIHLHGLQSHRCIHTRTIITILQLGNNADNIVPHVTGWIAIISAVAAMFLFVVYLLYTPSLSRPFPELLLQVTGSAASCLIH